MIDIIIPAYNAQKFIEKCLFSIALQTLKNSINVYVIDDCSDETYDEIVNKFKKILNINLIRLKSNRGPGYARQVGLDNSFGKYILFLDCDDALYDCFSIEKLYNATNNKENVIIYGFVEVEDKTGNKSKINNEGSLHGKLFCRNIIDKYKLKFYEGYNHEDLSFYLLYNSADIEKKYISDVVYSYVYNSKSITKENEEKYQFNKSKEYVNNIVWYVENAEKRFFNMSEIAENVYYSLIILYNRYMENYYQENVDYILEISKEILNLYRKYKNYISYEREVELFYTIFQKYIPIISFNDFFNKIDEYKLSDKKNDLISVIIPIYNKEKYISKTIESISNQTYKNLEIILIDDCSKDNSVKICKEFQKKDKRIKVILNDVNLGVSRTRNKGIEIAEGKYVGFVDADDTIKPEMYEKLYNYITKYDLDFVQCRNVGSGKKLENDFEVIKENENILTSYLSDDKISDTVWSKLFKKEVINNIKFCEKYKKHEDTLFIFDVVTKCKKICLLNLELYNYNILNNSLTNVKKFDSEINLLMIIDYVEKYIQEKYKYMMLLFYWYKLAKIIYFFKEIKNIKLNNEQKIILNRYVKQMKKYMNEAKKVDYQNLKNYKKVAKIIENYSNKK